MFDFLDRLREKPESYRLRVTIIAAAAITAVIVLIWLLTLEVDGREQVRADGSEASNLISPFRTIMSGLSEAFEGGRAQWEELRGALEGVPRNEDESL